MRKLAELEDRHWWYVERRWIVRRHLASLSGRGLVVDVGAAGGGNSREARRAGWDVVAIEYGETGAAIAAERGLSVARGDAHHLPVQDGVADLVLCLDVIEHLDDDVAALLEMRRALKPSGQLLLAVPADPGLWSKHDEAVGHLRRYTRESLISAVTAAGFTIDRMWSWNVLLKPLVRLRRNHSTGSDLEEVPALVNGVLRAAVATERVLPVGRLSGVSLFVAARA